MVTVYFTVSVVSLIFFFLVAFILFDEFNAVNHFICVLIIDIEINEGSLKLLQKEGFIKQ